MNDRITIKLAGHRLAIIDACGGLAALFEKYRAEDDFEPEFTIESSAESVNGIPVSTGVYSRFFLIHKLISNFLIDNGVLTVHASALRYENKAYLFSASSGTGKSTHTRFWRETFSDKVVMISDDQPLIRIDGNGVYACGSPYNGKEKLGSNIEAPVGDICLIERGEENRIELLSKAKALLYLSPNVYMPHESEYSQKALKLIKTLVETIPIYRHAATHDPSSAEYAMRHLIK